MAKRQKTSLSAIQHLDPKIAILLQSYIDANLIPILDEQFPNPTIFDADTLTRLEPTTLFCIFYPRSYLSHRYLSTHYKTSSGIPVFTARANNEWVTPTIFTQASLKYSIACWNCLLEAKEYTRLISANTLVQLFESVPDRTDNTLIHTIKDAAGQIVVFFLPAHPTHFLGPTTNSVILLPYETSATSPGLKNQLANAIKTTTRIHTYHAPLNGEKARSQVLRLAKRAFGVSVPSVSQLQYNFETPSLQDVYTVLPHHITTPFFVAKPSQNAVSIINRSSYLGVSNPTFHFNKDELDVHHPNLTTLTIYQQNVIFTRLITNGQITTTFNKHTHSNAHRVLVAPLMAPLTNLILHSAVFNLATILTVVRATPMRVACTHLASYNLCSLTPSMRTQHIISPRCLQTRATSDTPVSIQSETLPYDTILQLITEKHSKVTNHLFAYYNSQSNISFATIPRPNQSDTTTTTESFWASSIKASLPKGRQTDLDKAIIDASIPTIRGITQIARFIKGPTYTQRFTGYAEHVPTLLLVIYADQFIMPSGILNLFLTEASLQWITNIPAAVAFAAHVVYSLKEYISKNWNTGHDTGLEVPPIDFIRAAQKIAKKIICHAHALIQPSVNGDHPISAASVYYDSLSIDDRGIYYTDLCPTTYAREDSTYTCCPTCNAQRLVLTDAINQDIEIIFYSQPADVTFPKLIIFLHILSAAINRGAQNPDNLKNHLDTTISERLISSFHPCVQRILIPTADRFASLIASRFKAAFNVMKANHIINYNVPLSSLDQRYLIK